MPLRIVRQEILYNMVGDGTHKTIFMMNRFFEQGDIVMIKLDSIDNRHRFIVKNIKITHYLTLRITHGFTKCQPACESK